MGGCGGWNDAGACGCLDVLEIHVMTCVIVPDYLIVFVFEDIAENYLMLQVVCTLLCCFDDDSITLTTDIHHT